MGQKINIIIGDNYRLRLNAYVASPHIESPSVVLFYLDTGSPRTIISEFQADKLGIQVQSLPIDPIPLSGFGEGKVQARNLENVLLSINAGDKVINVPLDKITIGMKAKRKGTKRNAPVPNVAGADFFMNSGLILYVNLRKGIAYLEEE